MDTTLDFVHLAILKDAAQIANEAYFAEFDPAKPQAWRPGRFKAPPGERRTMAFGEVFRADPVQSEKGGLTLSVDRHIFERLDSEQQFRIREIGKSAIKQSIIKNKNSFVGLILGEARQGRNYFDRFNQSDQLRLF